MEMTYFVLRLPFTIGVVITLLRGWLRTERGTVIRAGNFPCSVKKSNVPETGGVKI